MQKVVINENQRGFLFRKGRFAGLLEPGTYRFFGANVQVETSFLDQNLRSDRCALDTLLSCPEIAKQTAVADVPDQHLALHFVNGKFQNVLRQGRCAFWSVFDRHEFQLVDISSPVVDESVPRYIFSYIPAMFYTRVDVSPYQKARLYFNKQFQGLLEPGTYYFWKTGTAVDVSYVDTRLTQMNVTGQEILTQDKVSLRINFVCNVRVTDCVKVVTEIDDYEEQIHVAAQLALRDYVGRHKLDEILEEKEAISQYVLQRLQAQAAGWYVEIPGGGVKDIVLPGEIRDIMNTVLAAEKRAQASVITRREEVASTRSLLNTARLMEENATLFRLKEMEYMERICQNVGSIQVSGTGDLLAQLAALLKG